MSETPAIPDLDSMPALAAALERREPAFRKAMVAVAGYLTEGGIPNARYEDLRPTVMGGLAGAWKLQVRDRLVAFARSGDENLRLMHRDGTPQNVAYKVANAVDLSEFEGLPAIPRLVRKVAAERTAGHPEPVRRVVEDAEPLLADLVKVAQAMDWLRQRRVKRAPPGSGPPPPPLPAATRAAQEAVRSQMRTTLDGLRKAFADYVVDRVGKQAEALEKECAELLALVASRREEAKARREAGDPTFVGESNAIRQKRKLVSYLDGLARYVVSWDPNTFETKRLKDGPARARAFAERETESVFGLWTERNVEKLAPIVEAKGSVSFEVLRARASYSGVETAMALTFPDNSRFAFSNSVEYAVSPLGTPFARFPARFHDVRNPDGTLVRGPSEAKVKAAFVGKPAVEDETPAPPAP